MTSPWETELATFLTELSGVQQATLSLLQRKGELLARSDLPGLSGIAEEEQAAINRLQNCLDKRDRLLQSAKDEGLPNDSIESLALRIDLETSGRPLEGKCRESMHQARILQHQSLTNWVMTQRTLIHLSRMIEILATKGRPQSTYDRQKAKVPAHGGTLVDLVSN